MILFKKSLTWFIIVQILISEFVLLAVGLTRLSPLAVYYRPLQGALYIAANSLLFLPVYLVAGFVLGRVFRIDPDRKSLTTTTLLCAVILTTLFAITAMIDKHGTWLLYTYFNVPHGWTMMRITAASDYRSVAGLLYTIAPPLVFTIGIAIQDTLAQQKARKAEEKALAAQEKEAARKAADEAKKAGAGAPGVKGLAAGATATGAAAADAAAGDAGAGADAGGTAAGGTAAGGASGEADTAKSRASSGGAGEAGDDEDDDFAPFVAAQ